MKTGVMLDGTAVILPLIISGTTRLLSRFNLVTIRVTVTSLSPSTAVKAKCHNFCIW